MLTECGAVRAARVTDARSRQLRLSWNRPDELNGILLGYSLTYTGTYANDLPLLAHIKSKMSTK